MSSISAKDVLDGATGILTFDGVGANIPGGSTVSFRSSRTPMPFIIKFFNNSDFNLFTTDMRPIRMFKDDYETLRSDGTTGYGGENNFFFSFDRYESQNRIDMSQVSPSVFTDHYVYMKSPLTARSFGYWYPNSLTYDNNSWLRSWDIYDRQARVNFNITQKNRFSQIYDKINNNNNMLANCCTSKYDLIDADQATAQKVCNAMAFSPNTSTCDNLMDSYCPANLGNPVCSCYLNRASVLASPTLMDQYPLAKYATQPQCWNGDCLTAGYKNNGIRTSAACPSITVCTQDINKISGANNILKNVLVTQNCGDQTIPTTNSTNNPTSDASILDWIKSNLLIVFVLLIALIYIFMDNDQPQVPYVAYVRPQYV